MPATACFLWSGGGEPDSARCWEKAEEGEGQAVLLGGEAGVGKSRLIADSSSVLRENRIAAFATSARRTTGSAFHPVISQLERATGFAPTD